MWPVHACKTWGFCFEIWTIVWQNQQKLNESGTHIFSVKLWIWHWHSPKGLLSNLRVGTILLTNNICQCVLTSELLFSKSDKTAVCIAYSVWHRSCGFDPWWFIQSKYFKNWHLHVHVIGHTACVQHCRPGPLAPWSLCWKNIIVNNYHCIIQSKSGKDKIRLRYWCHSGLFTEKLWLWEVMIANFERITFLIYFVMHYCIISLHIICHWNAPFNISAKNWIPYFSDGKVKIEGPCRGNENKTVKRPLKQWLTKAATCHLLSNLCKRFDTLIVFLKEFFAKKSLDYNKSMKVIQHAKSKISYTKVSSNNARACGRSLFWCLSLFVMCKAWHQYNEHLKALTFLNSPLVYIAA